MAGLVRSGSASLSVRDGSLRGAMCHGVEQCTVRRHPLVPREGCLGGGGGGGLGGGGGRVRRGLASFIRPVGALHSSSFCSSLSSVSSSVSSSSMRGVSLRGRAVEPSRGDATPAGRMATMSLTNTSSSGASRSTSRQEQTNNNSNKKRKNTPRNIGREKSIYQGAAIAASSLVIAAAIVATYLRIAWHLDHDEAFPYFDLLSTLLLAVGGMVGMEMYARYIHRYAWHDAAAGWKIHKTHHEPRTGAFEANDLYAVMNAVPAIGLTGYGFLREDVVGGVCFGLGLGITLFGMAYMFVHDGLVHKRFPVGPVKDVPGLRRIAVAHRMHHMDQYDSIPYGMFLGPQELEAAGFGEDLDALVAREMEKEKEMAGRRLKGK